MKANGLIYMKNIFAFLFIISAMCGFTFAQSALPTLEKIKQLKLLESTREDAIKLLNNEYVGYSDSQNFHISEFFAEDANVRVFYSSGNCSDEDEDWNAPEGKVVKIIILPKGRFNIKDIGIEYFNLHKERPYKQYKNRYVYFDKKAGIEIFTISDSVQSISFSPSEKNFSSLCNKPEVKNYYLSKKWLRNPWMKNANIDLNYPADVTNLNLSQTEITAICNVETSSQKFSDKELKILISVSAVDPENDVLTYQYSISGGKIIGQGANVVWNLSGVKAGTYTITAVVDDGSGPSGKFMTKTVVVKECPAQ